MYSVVSGDTFELISRKVYGDEQFSERIRKANPGASIPLVVGSVLAIPEIPDLPSQIPPYTDELGPSDTIVRINGERFKFWQNITITKSLATFWTVSFQVPFEPTQAEFKNIFKPFSYSKVEVLQSGGLVFNGVIIKISPQVSQDKKTVTVDCYSVPGVLNDCTAPASSYPLEFENQSIVQIAKTLCEPFGIAVISQGDVGAPFEQVELEPNKKIFNFLTDLAKQRNLIISNNESGELLFYQATETGNPVATFRQGDQGPVFSVTPTFASQEYFSHVSGIEPAGVFSKGSQYTEKNPRLQGVIRPFTFKAEDTDQGTVKDAVRAKIGRMFGNAVTYELELDTFSDPDNIQYKPNTTIMVEYPDAMIYNLYEFTIKDVVTSRSPEKETIKLSLVIPESFRGETPKRLPWD